MDTCEDGDEWSEGVKVWHVFKCILNTSRHVFEVEVSKYKGIIDKRKFFGQEEIEPILWVGKRGLLQNRKRISQNNNKSGNRSLTATESEVEKYLKRIREHNGYIKKIRDKFSTEYFDKYPEKKEMMLKEEEELKAQKLQEALDLKENTEENNNQYSNRSMSLGLRNNNLKQNNISFSKNANPLKRIQENSGDIDEQKGERGKSLQNYSSGYKSIDNFGLSKHNISTPSNKENDLGILKKINRNTKAPWNIPLPKIK